MATILQNTLGQTVEESHATEGSGLISPYRRNKNLVFDGSWLFNKGRGVNFHRFLSKCPLYKLLAVSRCLYCV